MIGSRHHGPAAPLAVAASDFLDDVTPIVITYNEEANIARTLARLGWARKSWFSTAGAPMRLWRSYAPFGMSTSSTGHSTISRVSAISG